jgi:hypothetical protein
MKQNVSEQLRQILEEYSEQLGRNFDKVARETAKDTVQTLKNTSPRDTGDYARGWAYKKDKGDVVVYNKTDWQLTHLLEHGHAVANQYGEYGTKFNGQKVHIAPAEEKGNAELLEKLKSILGEGGGD